MSTYEPESEALFARMTVQPAEWRKSVINTAVVTLKNGGVWDRLSALYVFKAADKQSAYLNWIQNQTITESGLPVTHVADGYSEGLLTGDTDFLQTPNGIDSKFTETDAHYGVQIDFIRTFQKPVGSFGTFDASVIDDDSSNGMRGRVHNGAFYSWGGLDPAHYLLSQASGALTPYKNGTASSSPITQTAPAPNGTFRLLRGNGFGSPPNYRISAFHVGQSLTSAQVTTLHNALQAYYSAIDAGPPLSGSALCAATAVASEAGVSVYYLGAGSFFYSDAGGTPGLPSGVQDGDLLLLVIETANQGISVSSPSGWQHVTGSPLGTGTANGTESTRLTVFWKRHQTGDAAPTITDSGNHQAARVFAFRNVQPSGDPWHAIASDLLETELSGIVIPGLTTTAEDALIVDIVAHGRDVTTTNHVFGYQNDSVVGLQEVADNSGTLANGGGFAVATSRKLVPGAVSETTAILSGAFRQARMKIALVSGAGGQQALSGSLTCESSVAGAVTLATPLDGEALTVAGASGALSKVAGLTGTALSDVGSAIAPLSVAKPVGGAASNVASASAGLSVSGTLSGVALVIATAASAGLSKTATLSGSALSDVQPVVAPLAVSKPLGGTLAALSTATADLLATGSMSGAALSVVAATGALSKTAPIAGLAAGLTSASATPTVAKPLVAPALAEAQAAAALGKVATLAGSASGLSSAVASFAGDASVSGSAAGLASASASLAKTATLAGTALTVASAAATLAGEAALAAEGLSTASAQATLSKECLLVAVAVVDVASTGDLSAAGALGLSGEASVVSSASASLSALKALAGPAQVIASAAASVTTTSLGPTGRIVMTIKPMTLKMEVTAETVGRTGIRRINQAA